MDNQNILNLLEEKGVISGQQAAKIEIAEQNQPFSLHWELRTILYLGITFLSTGLGTLIYKNIDSIGHNIIIAFIALLCLGCFFYAYKHKAPFTWQESSQSDNLSDFALLGGCFAFLSLEGYLQYQYNLFGNRYGLAALIPAILFFYSAYYFDNRGVLSMAITAFASWIGLTVAPAALWESNKLNTETLIVTALSFGFLLILVGWFSEKRELKKHFAFTYLLFGSNLAFVAALTGLFILDLKVVYFIVAGVLSFLSINYAKQRQSYLFLLMGVIYGFIAFTYGFFNIMPNDLDFLSYLWYFLLTAFGIIYFLINIKKILGIKK